MRSMFLEVIEKQKRPARRRLQSPRGALVGVDLSARIMAHKRDKYSLVARGYVQYPHSKRTMAPQVISAPPRGTATGALVAHQKKARKKTSPILTPAGATATKLPSTIQHTPITNSKVSMVMSSPPRVEFEFTPVGRCRCGVRCQNERAAIKTSRRFLLAVWCGRVAGLWSAYRPSSQLPHTARTRPHQPVDRRALSPRDSPPPTRAGERAYPPGSRTAPPTEPGPPG